MESNTERKTAAYSAQPRLTQKPLMAWVADIIKAFRRFWWIAGILGLSVGVVLLYQGYKKVSGSYTASASFYITVQSNNYAYTNIYSQGTASQMAETFPYLLQSELLQDVVKEELGVDYLNGSIYATGVEDTNLFTLNVISNNAQDAYDILLAVMEYYPRVAEYVIGNTHLELLSEPTLPDADAIDQSYISNSIRYSALATTLGVIIILLSMLWRRTICTTEDFESLLNLKCITVIPKVSLKRRSKHREHRSLLVSTQHSGYAMLEPMRSLRTRLIRKMEELDAHVLVITSTKAGEGKTTIAANLALTFAKKGESVVLVDCDLRKPSVHSVFEAAEPVNGIVDILEQRCKLTDALTVGKNYRLRIIMGKGHQKNPLKLLGSENMAQLISRLRKTNKYVILDAPPCGVYADASALMNLADCALFVVRQDDASISSVLDGVQSLSFCNKPILGAVLNRAEYGIIGYGYGYGRGYGYGYGSNYYRKGYGSYYNKAGGYGKYGRYGKYGYGYGVSSTEGSQTVSVDPESSRNEGDIKED